MRSINTVLFLVLLVTGCGDPKPPLADLRYSISCSEGATCDPLLSGGRAINQFNGAKGVSVTCSAVSIDDNINLTLSAIDVAESLRFGIDIRGLRLDSETSAVGGSACKATVFDGDVPFGGASLGVCGPAVPSATQPCQITNASIDGDTVELAMSCVELESPITGELIDVSGVGSSETASLVFENCEGL